MFGITVIKTKKLNSILESAANLSLDNLTLAKRLAEAKGIAEYALKQHDYIKSTNRTDSSKGQNYRRILTKFIEAIKKV